MTEMSDLCYLRKPRISSSGRQSTLHLENNTLLDENPESVDSKV